MSFAIDITRAHIGSAPDPIPLNEWLALVNKQPNMTCDKDGRAIWNTTSDEDPVGFNYSDYRGTIIIYPPNRETMAKAIELAEPLQAMVIGEAEERYMADGRYLMDDGEGGYTDEGDRWDNEDYWEEPPVRPPLTRWDRLGNWWFRLKVAWRTRNI